MTPQTPSSSITLTVTPTPIHLTRYHGDGPPLLLIHGISSDGGGWDPVIDDLARNFTPITMDLRGHGRSGKPEGGYLYDDYIGDLDRVLDALELESPLIIGHSLGGLITLWWAAQHPDRAQALVIEDSPLRSGEEFRPAFENWLKLNAMPYDELVALYASEHPGWDREMVESRAWAMHTTQRAVFEELMQDSMANHGVDRIAEIECIQSPVLLVHGDLDTGGMVHPEDAEALSDRLSNAQTYRITGGGHILHRSTKEDFLDAAVPFLLAHADSSS